MAAESTDRLSFLEKEIVAHLFVARPTLASYLGLHEYDGLLPDLSVDSTDRWRATAKELLRQLAELPESDLTAPRRHDRNLLRLSLEGTLFDFEETRELDRNPMNYLFQPDLTNYISRDYAPVADRVAAIVRVLTTVPSLLDAAKRRLEPVLPGRSSRSRSRSRGGCPPTSRRASRSPRAAPPRSGTRYERRGKAPKPRFVRSPNGSRPSGYPTPSTSSRSAVNGSSGSSGSGKGSRCPSKRCCGGATLT